MRILSLLAAMILALCAPLAEAADLTQTVLLVAKRNLRDRLYGSSILIAKPIGDERHVGFIMNKPTTMTPEVIFAMVKDAKSPGGRSLQLTSGIYLAYDSA